MHFTFLAHLALTTLGFSQVACLTSHYTPWLRSIGAMVQPNLAHLVARIKPMHG